MVNTLSELELLVLHREEALKRQELEAFVHSKIKAKLLYFIFDQNF